METGNKQLIAQALRRDQAVRRIEQAFGAQTFNLIGLADLPKIVLWDYLTRQRRSVIVVADELRARAVKADWESWSGRPAWILRQRQLDFTDAVAASREAELQRCAILSRWLAGTSEISETADAKSRDSQNNQTATERFLLIVVAAALTDLYPEADYFRQTALRFLPGEAYDLTKLAERLSEIGYERARQVEAAGQFAVRGDLLDIGLAVPDQPQSVQSIRLSFFDSELDDIRSFDVDTQRSITTLSEIIVPPAREWLIPKTSREQLAQSIEQAADHQKREVYRKGGSREIGEAFGRLGRRDADRVRQGYYFSGLDRWFFLYAKKQQRFLDWLSHSQELIAWDEPAQIRHRLDAVQAEFEQQFAAYLEHAQAVAKAHTVRLRATEAMRGAADCPAVAFAQIDGAGNGLPGARKFHFLARPSDQYRGRENVLTTDLTRWNQDGYLCLLFAGSESRASRLREFLPTGHAQMVILNEVLNRGFVWPEAKLAVIGSHDIFGAEKKRRRTRRKGLAIDFFSDLRPGEIVVHETHGIGRYNGLKTLGEGGSKRDYLHISYAGTDQLYIPLEQLDQIQKYVATDSHKPKLSKLGGQEWSKTKTRAKESIRKLATDLLELYAKRARLKGHAFQEDTVWQEQFEDTFMYEETEDQTVALDEIKSDMESDRVMDRLLCGDVGFGKTEIAFRAMFKAVMSGKQTALLAPTTVLAQQHYTTFMSRLGEFPLRARLLSRFVPDAQRKDTLKGLANGSVDLVIGTHRLLSKDVMFKNLGLLVVDEEQRFGVDHKEGLKERYPTVDVLTLTATPIPRTLHMTMSGIRDISVLEEGPEDRRPIQTYVMEYDPAILSEAILREVSRGGQVFYLFNNTHQIAEKAAEIAQWLPGLRVGYAHGQMGERRLEKEMEHFSDAEYDVLVCTTIIESGLDLPNVNTLVIENADRLGLAQMYQLRGRVGRSDRQAYAYVTYRPDRALNEDAVKRLAAIRDYTELGSGFKIALRDLEVRGAGNLLGAEQHGHLEAIGYDLYCKLLEASIRELKGEEPLTKKPLALIELNVDAMLPASYVPDEGQRMDLYRRINRIEHLTDYRDVLDEMLDRYGDPPSEAVTLCDIALVRSLAGMVGISHIRQQGQDLILSISQEGLDMKRISLLFESATYRDRLVFNAGSNPYLIFRRAARDEQNAPCILRRLLSLIEA